MDTLYDIEGKRGQPEIHDHPSTSVSGYRAHIDTRNTIHRNVASSYIGDRLYRVRYVSLVAEIPPQDSVSSSPTGSPRCQLDIRKPSANLQYRKFQDAGAMDFPIRSNIEVQGLVQCAFTLVATGSVAGDTSLTRDFRRTTCIRWIPKR